MDAGQTRHPVHVLRGGVDVAVLEVVEDGVVKQDRILQQQPCRRGRESDGGEERREEGRGGERDKSQASENFFFFLLLQKTQAADKGKGRREKATQRK